jgi:hypothetical protein
MSMTLTVASNEVETLIRENANNGQFFTVNFTKRTTGEERTMNARLGVKKHLRGGELSFDPKEKNLLICFDAQSGGYRSINLDSVHWVKVGGKTYQVK